MNQNASNNLWHKGNQSHKLNNPRISYYTRGGIRLWVLASTQRERSKIQRGAPPSLTPTETYYFPVEHVQTVLNFAQYTGQNEYNMNYLNTKKTAFLLLLTQMTMSLLLWLSRKDYSSLFLLNDFVEKYHQNLSSTSLAMNMALKQKDPIITLLSSDGHRLTGSINPLHLVVINNILQKNSKIFGPMETRLLDPQLEAQLTTLQAMHSNLKNTNTPTH